MPAQTDHHVGGTKHFECRVKGHPRPEIRWYKDGKEITKIPRYQFDYTHEGVISMVIPNITHDDEGHYRCRAENSEGMASTSAYLFVRTHKEHPDEEGTSVHAMKIEETVVFTEKEKKAKKEQKAKSSGSEPHFETPIEDVDADMSKERRLSKEEEEIVRKSFESVIEASASTREISSSSSAASKSASKLQKNGSEQESAKISKDLSEKSYHSSEDSGDDVDSVRLKTISERSETTSVQEFLQDLDDGEGSLLMRQTKRLFSEDYGEDGELMKVGESMSSQSSASKSTVTMSSRSETIASKQESVTVTTESSTSKMESTASKSESRSRSGKIEASELEIDGSAASSMSQTASVTAVSQTSSGGKTEISVEEASMSSSRTATADKDGILTTESSISSSSKSVTESGGASGVTAEISTDQKTTKALKADAEVEVKRLAGKAEDEGEESMTESESCNSVASVISVEVDTAAKSASQKLGKQESKEKDDIEEDARRKKKAEEEELKRKKAEEEELNRKKAEEEEQKRKKAEEEELKRKKAEEEELNRKKAEEEEQKRKKAEEEELKRKKVEEEELKRKKVEEEELNRKKAEEEELKRKKAEEEEQKRKKAEEEELKRKKAEEEELKRKKAEEEELKKKAEEEERKKAEEEELNRKKAEEEKLNRKKAEEEELKRKKAEEEELKRKKAEEEEQEQKRKKAEEEELKRKKIEEEEEELKRRKAEEELQRKKAEEEEELKKKKAEEEELQKRKEKTDEKDEDGRHEDKRGRRGSGSDEPGEETVEEVADRRSSWVEKVKEDKESERAEVQEVGEEDEEAGGTRQRQILMKELDDESRTQVKVIQKMEKVEVEAGRTLRLCTGVHGESVPEVIWSKDGTRLSQGDRITFVTENELYSLEITNVGESDSGIYRLTAISNGNEAFTDIPVSVTTVEGMNLAPGWEELRMEATVGAPQFMVQPQDVSLAESETIHLTCTVRGDPEPKVTWEKDGKQVRSNRHVRVYEARGMYNLEIRDCEAEDGGEYVCTAVNSQGRVTATVQVTIEGAEAFASTAEEAEPEGATGGAPAVTGAAESSSDELFLKSYLVLTSYTDPDTNVTFQGGETVEVLDSKQKTGAWLVRGKVEKDKVCFVPASLLCVAGDLGVGDKKKEDESEEEDSSQRKKEKKMIHSPKQAQSPKHGSIDLDDTSEDELRLRGIYPDYVAIADYTPAAGDTNSIRLSEGQIVEVIDKERADSWLVKTRPTKSSPSRQGWVPSAYLEEKAVSSQFMRRSTRETFREEVLHVSNKSQEAGLKRRPLAITPAGENPFVYVLKEMEETEREYVKELKTLVETYVERVNASPETVPLSVTANAETVFSNIADIYKFHDSQFLPDIGDCVANPSAIGSTFLKWQCEFDNYIKFWADREAASFLLDTEEIKNFFKDLGCKLSDSEDAIMELLKRPLDRLKMYQLLLKDVLRYSSRAGEDCSEVEAAIAMLIAIEKAVENSKLIPLLEGFEGDISELGKLLRHDDVGLWEGDVTTSSRVKDRHVFLFPDKVIMTKRKKPDSSGDQSGFSYRTAVDLVDVRLNEAVLEDERRFELWFQDDSAVEKVTLQARSVAAKQAWARDIREALLKLGVSEPDIMPEKTTEGTEDQVTAPSSAPTTPTSAGQELGSELEDSSKDAVTDDSETVSSPGQVEVKVTEPFFKHDLKKVVCHEGSSARLECTVGGNPTPSVSWLKGDKPVKEGEGIKITTEGETSSLIFTETKASNSGTYTVTISNDAGSTSASADLVVFEDLPETDTSTDRTNGEVGDTESGSETVTEEVDPSHTFVNGEEETRSRREEVTEEVESRTEKVEEDGREVVVEQIERREKRESKFEDSETQQEVVQVEEEFRSFRSRRRVVEEEEELLFTEEKKVEDKVDAAEEESKSSVQALEEEVDVQESKVSEEEAVKSAGVEEQSSRRSRRRRGDTEDLSASTESYVDSLVESAVSLAQQEGVNRRQSTETETTEELAKSAYTESQVNQESVEQDAVQEITQEVRRKASETQLQVEVDTETVTKRQGEGSLVAEAEVDIVSETQSEATFGQKSEKAGEAKFEVEADTETVRKGQKKERLVAEAEVDVTSETQIEATFGQTEEAEKAKLEVEVDTETVTKKLKKESLVAEAEADIVSETQAEATFGEADKAERAGESEVEVDVNTETVTKREKEESLVAEAEADIVSETQSEATFDQTDKAEQTGETKLEVEVDTEAVTKKPKEESLVAEAEVDVTSETQAEATFGEAEESEKAGESELEVDTKRVRKRQKEESLVTEAEVDVTSETQAEATFGEAEKSEKAGESELEVDTKRVRKRQKEESLVAEAEVDIKSESQSEATFDKKSEKAGETRFEAEVETETVTKKPEEESLVAEAEVDVTSETQAEATFGEAEKSEKAGESELEVDTKRVRKRQKEESLIAEAETDVTSETQAEATFGQAIKAEKASESETSTSALAEVDVQQKSETEVEAKFADTETSRKGEDTEASFKTETPEAEGKPKSEAEVKADFGETTTLGQDADAEVTLKTAEVPKAQAEVKEKSETAVDAEFGSAVAPGKDTEAEATLQEVSKPQDTGAQKSETVTEVTPRETAGPSDSAAAEVKATKAELEAPDKGEESVEDSLSASRRKRSSLGGESVREDLEKSVRKADSELQRKEDLKTKAEETSEEKLDRFKVKGDKRKESVGEVSRPEEAKGKKEVSEKKEATAKDKEEKEEVKKTEKPRQEVKFDVEDKEEDRKEVGKKDRAEAKAEEKRKKEETREPLAPQVLKTMDDCVTELGQLARFDCRVSAYPDPEITWFKDGNKVVPSSKHELLNFHDDIFSLLIKKVDDDDSGRYTCMARNEFGEARTEAILNVIGLKVKITDAHVAPSFQTKFYDMEAVEGVPVEFVCIIDGNPDPSVTWLLNGKEVESSSEILTRRQEDSVMLAFRSAKMEHSGEIICKLKNDCGEAICKARLKVKEDLSKKGDRPIFVEQPSDKEVSEGGEITFECVISGLPDPDVTWYFNGRELHESRRRTMRRKAGQKYSLTIREVIPENAGVYTCKAVNRAGDASCAVELSVKELPTDQALKGRSFDANLDYDSAKYAFPPSFTRRIQDQRVLPGRMARFEAMVIGAPDPEVEWQKDGFTLKWGPKYKIGREGHTAILVVEASGSLDEGTYTCNLFNEAGKATCSAQLKVQEERSRLSMPRLLTPGRGVDGFRPEPSPAPRKSLIKEMAPEDKIPSMPIDKPVLLDIRPNATKLSWMPAPTAYLPENAQKITYTVEARELPSKQWVRLDGNIEATTHYVHGLKPDKEYMFRVKADNRYGTSEPTLPCTLLPREEPKIRESMLRDTGTPVRPVLPKTRPYVSHIGKETIQLGWKPAEVPYAGRSMSVPPVSYRVEAQKLPSEEWVPLASRVKKPSFYLSDLEADRDYNIRVRAQTPYGVTPPTEPVWIPRAKAFTGVPVTRPTIVEIEEGTARLQWNRVDIPAFDSMDEPLLYMIEMQEPPSYRWRELAHRVPTNHYIVRDLEPGQDYRFRVRAESRDGLLSEPSPATSVFRTLAMRYTPVDRLEVDEYDADLQSARLSWRRVDVPPYATDDSPLLYMIEYENPEIEGWRPLVSGIPTTRYRVPDISPTDDYRFRVRAISPYGVSPPSYPTGLYRRTSPMRPLAQDLALSSVERDSVRLSWRSASVPPPRTGEPPLSYQIEALEYPKQEWRPLATNIRDTSYRLGGLKPSSDYSFRIRAQTPSGLAEPTAPVTLTSLPVRPRLPVREPIISELGSDSVRLQWKPAELPYYSRHTTPINYNVEYQEVPSRDWVVAARSIPETSYTIRGLRGDRDYRFRICPETEYGLGEYSLPVHAHRHIAPKLPTREPHISNIAPASATLSWQPASLASGSPTRPIVYRVEGREPPSSHWFEVAGRVPSTSYNLQFLSPDQDYMFRVIADYDGVESEPTMAVYLPRRAGPPKMARDAPYVSSVEPDSVILAWRSVELPSRITDYSPVSYRIEYQEHPRGDWRPLARQITQTHFHVTKLRPDMDYSFRVRAENEFGISDPTDPVLIRKRAVAPVMSQMEPLLSDVRSDAVRLTWRPAEMPSYLTDSVPITYNILMQEDGYPTWQTIARRVAGTSYYVSGLSPDKDYSFRVQAENDFGSSLPTVPVRLHRKLKGPIYSPEVEDVESSSFRLSWKQPSLSKPTTYSVESWEPSTWKWRPLVSRLPHPSYKVTGIQPTKDYAFRVRAEVDSVITEPSLPISFSSRRALPTVPVERPTLSEVYDDSVRVNWHPNFYYGATRKSTPQTYRLEVREPPDTYWHTLIPRTDAHSYEVTDLKPGQDYAFRVRTVTDTGMSEPSLPVFLYRQSATPRIPLPSPEISEMGDSSIGLNWKLVDVPAFDMDETPLSFMIEAQRMPDYDWQPVARGVTGSYHKVTGLEPKHDYKFRLRGETSVGLTQPSTPISFYRKPVRTGVPITNVRIQTDSNQPYAAKLRWNPVYIQPYRTARDVGYTIEVQEPPRTDWYVLARDVPSTHYNVPDLSPKKDYLFRVKARTPGAEYSAPTPPIPYYRALSSTSPWDRLPPKINKPVDEYAPIARPYIEGLILKVPPRMSIEKPEMVVLSPDVVSLTWKSARVPTATADLSPTTYRVESRHEDSFEWIEKATGIKGLTTEIKGLNPHIDYAFRVRAVNDFGWSESTLPVFLHRPQDLKDEAAEMEFEQLETYGSSMFSDMSAPRMPMDTPRLGVVQDRQMSLSWTPARIPAYARKTPITYVVEKKEPYDQDWVPLASRLENISYTVKDIEPKQDYLFRVRAENEYGLSEATLPAALTRSKTPRFIRSSASRERELEPAGPRRSSYIDSISSGVPPRVPSGRPSLSDVTDTQAVLSWQPGRMPSYIKGPVTLKYVVESREPPNHLWNKLSENVTATTYKLEGLRPDQDYMFRVRCFNDSGMSEPTLPVTLARERAPEVEPRTMRRRSSVERFSSVERRVSRERSMSMDRSSSIPRALPKDSARKDVDEEDMFAGKTPDTTPAAPEFVADQCAEVQQGIDCRPVKLTLQLRGLPLPTVDWFFNGKKILYGDRYEGYVTPTGLVVLEFSPMGWPDVGDYKCVAENDQGESTFTVKLQMADPPTFLEPMKDLNLESQTNGQFTCRVDGIPYPSVKFMKDWRPITESARLKVTQDGDRWTLEVAKAIPADAGCYICVAENDGGKVFCTARLNVDDEMPTSSVYYKKTNFEDDYYILEELGRGRHGIVRRVIERQTGKEFAAKFMKVREEKDKDFFRLELDALLRQKGDNVEKLHDAYETQQQLVLVVEPLKGGNLLDCVTSDKNWTEGKAAQVIRQLLLALKDIHDSGFVHLDVKPTNLRFTSPDYTSLCLSDFGFSRKLPLSSDLTFNYGTPEFCSPEAITNEPVTPATDVWSVGVLTHLLLTGVSPFHAESVGDTLCRTQTCNWSLDPSLFSGISSSAQDFISRLLVREPQSRLSLDACLGHDWLKLADKPDGTTKLDTSRLKSFQDRTLAEQKESAVRTVATLRSLKRLLEGPISVQGLQPEADPQTGEVTLPDTEEYGEYLDEESWYDWQSRHQQGPDTELFPLKDAPYTARVRGYKRAAGSIDEPPSMVVDSDEELDPRDKQRLKTMKERRLMSEIDKEEIPPSLEKELEWKEEAKKRRQSRDADEASLSSKRSSVASVSTEGMPGPVFREKLHDMAFGVDDTVILRCVVVMPPTATVVWYKNEELLTEGNRLKMNLEPDGEATLTIRNAKPYDAGVYKCVGRNKFGRVSNRMRLQLGDVPGRPGQPVVSQISGTEALVLWEAPRSDGHADILFYKLDYRAKGQDKWTTGAYTTCEAAILSSLQPSTQYRFRVSATNRFGTSHYSWASVEVSTPAEGSMPVTSGSFFDLPKLRSLQQEKQPALPTEFDDIIPEEELGKEEKGPVILTSDPESTYNLGDVLYKGKFYEDKAITLPSDNDKPFVLRTVPAKAGQREFDLLKSLRHERLVRLFTAFSTADYLHLVLEHWEGEHIARHLCRRRKYSENMVATVIRQVLFGLEFLQRSNIVHLNLQPASIVVSKLEGCEVKLTDFSLARKISGPVGEIAPRLGYADFIPPEVVVQDLAGFPADVWGVGTLTFLLLSGISPFHGHNYESTLVNIALNRYDCVDLYENVTTEALKFLFKVMKRLPRNRPGLQDCLDHKWLQLTDKILKEREDTIFLTNTLATFVQEYDAARWDDSFRQDFTQEKLPVQMSKAIPYEARPDRKEGEKQSRGKRVTYKDMEEKLFTVERKAPQESPLSLEEKLQRKADKIAGEMVDTDRQKEAGQGKIEEETGDVKGGKEALSEKKHSDSLSETKPVQDSSKSEMSTQSTESDSKKDTNIEATLAKAEKVATKIVSQVLGEALKSATVESTEPIKSTEAVKSDLSTSQTTEDKA